MPAGLFPIEGNRKEGKGRKPVKFRKSSTYKKKCYIDDLQKDKAPLNNQKNVGGGFFVFVFLLVPYNPWKQCMPCLAQVPITLKEVSKFLKITRKSKVF